MCEGVDVGQPMARDVATGQLVLSGVDSPCTKRKRPICDTFTTTCDYLVFATKILPFVTNVTSC